MRFPQSHYTIKLAFRRRKVCLSLQRVLAGLVIVTMVVGTISTPYSVHARGNAVLEECELGTVHELTEEAEIMGGYCVGCGCTSIGQRSSERIVRVEKKVPCYRNMGSDMIIEYEISTYNQCNNCGLTFGNRTYTEKRWACMH